jgi:two-component system cell cycle sensor histidine kinase/response regulator CckA
MEKKVEEGLPCGNETILIVDDNHEVRKVTGRILSMQGYRVLEASNPNIAFSTCSQHEGPIHLLITDVVMPEMNGPQLVKHLISQHPEMKALYMSGYVKNFISYQGILGKGADYIQKPFTVNELAKKVREVLDR